jgi:hypothetical protein
MFLLSAVEMVNTMYALLDQGAPDSVWSSSSLKVATGGSSSTLLPGV